MRNRGANSSVATSTRGAGAKTRVAVRVSPPSPHVQQSRPAPSASGHFEVEWAGATAVVALAGWYTAPSGRTRPAG